MVWPGRPDSGLRWQKKGLLGSLKKRIFRPRENDGFFALFEKRHKTPVAINKYGHLVKRGFFVFVPKRVKNRVEKNIVSSLP
jgi:hypothetical protein